MNMETEREQVIRENQMRNQLQTVDLTFKIPAQKYRALAEMSRKSGVESLKFFSEPSLLKCPFCPCANPDGGSCAKEVDETCASAFYKIIVMEAAK